MKNSAEFSLIFTMTRFPFRACAAADAEAMPDRGNQPRRDAGGRVSVQSGVTDGILPWRRSHALARNRRISHGACFFLAAFRLSLDFRDGRLVIFGEMRLVVALRAVRIAWIGTAHACFCRKQSLLLH